jgi:branched-chain amino acid transport system ATP-binding protein
MLEINNLDVKYGPRLVLKKISMTVADGEIVALIGANGAGKTSLINTISGLVSPNAGEIRYRGKSIGGMEPHEILRMGIGQVPEGRKMFPEMTVHENLLLGGYSTRNVEVLAERLDFVFSLFPVIKERLGQIATTLSGGQQQMLAIARALMSNPDLLMLDEPTMGLAPIIVESVGDIVSRLRDQGKTILLVEQNASLALDLADRGYVLETGEIVLSDVASRLAENEEVRRAYLGV